MRMVFSCLATSIVVLMRSPNRSSVNACNVWTWRIVESFKEDFFEEGLFPNQSKGKRQLGIALGLRLNWGKKWIIKQLLNSVVTNITPAFCLANCLAFCQCQSNQHVCVRRIHFQTIVFNKASYVFRSSWSIGCTIKFQIGRSISDDFCCSQEHSSFVSLFLLETNSWPQTADWRTFLSCPL